MKIFTDTIISENQLVSVIFVSGSIYAIFQFYMFLRYLYEKFNIIYEIFSYNFIQIIVQITKILTLIIMTKP